MIRGVLNFLTVPLLGVTAAQLLALTPGDVLHPNREPPMTPGEQAVIGLAIAALSVVGVVLLIASRDAIPDGRRWLNNLVPRGRRWLDRRRRERTRFRNFGFRPAPGPVKRRLLNLLTIVSLLLCLSVAPMWMRSYLHADVYEYAAERGQRRQVTSAKGRIRFDNEPQRRIEMALFLQEKAKWDADLLLLELERTRADRNAWAYRAGRRPSPHLAQADSLEAQLEFARRRSDPRLAPGPHMAISGGVVTPQLSPAKSSSVHYATIEGIFLLCAAASSLWRIDWRSRRRRRLESGLCLTCGYALTGNVSGVCPECGKPT